MSRPDLLAACGECAALCCIWTAFDASADFALAKPAGVVCPHLARGRCGIHPDLVARGFGGCACYDCHGAGPRATRLFAATPGLADPERLALFAILSELHELLWILDGAAALCRAHPALAADLARALAALDALATADAATLLAADLAPHRRAARTLLGRVRAVDSPLP